jgi:hypothetical protein
MYYLQQKASSPHKSALSMPREETMIEFLAGAFVTGMILLAVYARHLENDIRHVEEYKKRNRLA